MRSRKDQTKTELVVNTLREGILHCQFPNGNLPSKLELAEHFKVSHRTIDCALKLLRTEGLIRGVRGTGIFINQKMSDVSNLTHRLILMVLPKDTFHESEPYSSLRAEVFRNGLFPINLSLLSGPEEETTLFERASLTQLLPVADPRSGLQRTKLLAGAVSGFLEKSPLRRARSLRRGGRSAGKHRPDRL